MADAAAPAATGAPSGGGAQESVETKVPASDGKVDRKARVAAQREEAARKHGRTVARDGFDPKREARRAMAERKSELRLAAKDGETVDGDHEFDSGEGEETEAISPDHATDSEPSPEAQDEREPEKPPTWATKLKAENAEHKAREAKWNGAIQQIEARVNKAEGALQQRTYEVEDLRSDVKLRDGLIKQMQDMLEKVAPGQFVHESLQLVMERHRTRQLQRAQQRGQQQTQAQAQTAMRQQVQGEVRATMNALRQKHPELDWEKSADAKAFLTRYAQRGIPISAIGQDEINEFIAAQRFKAQNARRPQGQQGQRPPRPVDDPDASEVPVSRGQAGARRRGDAPVTVNTPITNGMARKLVRNFRAAKGARS